MNKFKNRSCILVILLLFLFGNSYSKNKTGTVKITSIPENAEIIIDGSFTGLYSPAVLEFSDTLTHELELKLPEHIFTKRTFRAFPDSTVNISGNLVALSDTTMIIGDLALGILSLTTPPLKVPYNIDGKKVYSKDAILNSGLHHVIWNGGEIYSSLDTIIPIAPGKMTVLKFYPKRLSGDIYVEVIPEDAAIFLNKIQYGTGTVDASVNTGVYNLSVKRNGFTPYDSVITIKPGRDINLQLTLNRIPDEDKDGFLDSVDLCPMVYGLYDGCPKQKKGSAVKKYASMLGDNLKNQKFFISLDLLSWQSRTPLNEKEADFFSYFNDGLSFFNNYRGASILNGLSMGMKGFTINFEYSQYRQGIRYEKQNELGNGPVLFNKSALDTNTYCLYYDSLAGLSPMVMFPSVSLSAGINFKMQRFDFSFYVGYQWEHIVYTDIILYNDYEAYKNNETGYVSSGLGEYTGPRHDWEVNSDWVYAGLSLSYNLLKSTRNSLLIYGKFKVSVYDLEDIQWSSLSMGFTYRLIPSIRNKIGISTK